MRKIPGFFTASLFCNHGLRAIDFILDSQIVTQYSTLKTSKSLYFENKNNNYKVLFIYPFIASLLRPVILIYLETLFTLDIYIF